MSRTEEQIAADYHEFRGRCKELCEAAIAADPTLRIAKGFYWEPIWCREEQHWWCVRSDGSIYDPSARQFPSNGESTYREFDGWCDCEHCGRPVHETKACIDGHHVFCTNLCYAWHVGVASPGDGDDPALDDSWMDEPHPRDVGTPV